MPDPKKPHRFRAGPKIGEFETVPGADEIAALREIIEPWLSAVIQAEHLALLVGSGLGIAIATADGAAPLTMGTVKFGLKYEDKVDARAKRTAQAGGRASPNLEDQFRAAIALQEGLSIAQLPEAVEWEAALGKSLRDFVAAVLASEAGIAAALAKASSAGRAGLLGLLLSFASRPATRDRLHLFTTNYDRLIEHGCDLLGLRIVDRFVGSISPEFRTSRLDIDLHYNPPGIRGEPRYLEGVLRLTKLHGSIDWDLSEADWTIRRRPLPFGATSSHSEFPKSPFRNCMVFPNAAKDIETAFYPYAELFRDFAGAACRPNSTLVTYGYGFGDEHINRVIKNMLELPSTHLVIISYDDAGGRLQRFMDGVERVEQISMLVGSHFGSLGTLVKHYLPSPALDVMRHREAALRRRRGGGAGDNTESAE